MDSVASRDYVVPELRVVRLEVEATKKGIVASFDDPVKKICLKQEGREDLVIDYSDEATKLL